MTVRSCRWCAAKTAVVEPDLRRRTSAAPSSAGSQNSPAEPVTEQLPDVVDWLPAFAQPAWQAVDQFPLLAGLVLVGIYVVYLAHALAT